MKNKLKSRIPLAILRTALTVAVAVLLSCVSVFAEDSTSWIDTAASALPDEFRQTLEDSKNEVVIIDMTGNKISAENLKSDRNNGIEGAGLVVNNSGAWTGVYDETESALKISGSVLNGTSYNDIGMNIKWYAADSDARAGMIAASNASSYAVVTYKNPTLASTMRMLANEKKTAYTVSMRSSDTENYYSVIIPLSGDNRAVCRANSLSQGSAMFAFNPVAESYALDDADSLSYYIKSIVFANTLDDAAEWCEELASSEVTGGYHYSDDASVIYDMTSSATESPIGVAKVIPSVDSIILKAGDTYDISDIAFDVYPKNASEYSVTASLPADDAVAKTVDGTLTALTSGFTKLTLNVGGVVCEMPVYVDMPEYYCYDSAYVYDTFQKLSTGLSKSTVTDNDGASYARISSSQAVSSGRFDVYTQTDSVIAAAYPVVKIVYKSNIGAGETTANLRLDCYLDINSSAVSLGQYNFKYSGDEAVYSFVANNADLYSAWADRADLTNTYRGYIFRTNFTGADDYFDIKYIAYFKTVEDAEVFDPDKAEIEVSLDKHVYRMETGDTLTLKVTATSGAELTYSSDSDCVSVNENGVITAETLGEATVTVRAEIDGDYATDSIKIYVNEISAITVEKNKGQESPDSIPKIAFLGDSITAGSQTSKKYHEYLAESLYVTAVNKGLSGSNIAGVGSSGQTSFIDRVTSVPEDSDMVFVLGGINDFGQNKGDLARFESGIRTLIEKLIERFPSKPIVFSTPLQNGGYFSITTNKNGETLEEYVNEIKEACAEYNIPVINAWRNEAFKDFCTYDESGNINGYNETYYADGVHPKASGHAVMAEFYERQFETAGVVAYIDAYSITVNAIGNGSVSVGEATSKTYTDTLTENSTVTLTAVPDATYQVDGWYDVTDGKNVLLAKETDTYVHTAAEDMVIEVRFMSETIKVATKLSVSVGAGEGTIEVGGNAYEDYTDYANGGDTVEVTAKPNDGYAAAYWTRVSGGVETYIGTNETISVSPLGTSVIYKPVFIEAGTTVNLYVDAKGVIIATGEEPAVPDRIGYTGGKWLLDEESANVNVYVADYVKSDETYTLTVNYLDGTSEEKSFKYNQLITLTATAEDTQWVLNGTVVSNASEYSFYITFIEDVVIEEVAAGEAEAVLAVTNTVYDAGSKKIKFMVSFELVEGMEFVETGVLLSNNADIAETMEIGDEGVITGKSSAANASAGNYIINKGGVSVGDTWYGRAYLICKQDGETTVIYADTVSHTAE